MKTLKTAIVGTAAATAMAVSATPATAKGGHNNDGISAGEVIAGAVVLGGLAAILTSGKNDRYNNNYDRGYRGDRYQNYDYGHNQRIRPRRAVNKCVRAAENRASRWGRANVTEVRKVDRTRYGYKVSGRIAVQDNRRSRHYRSGYNRRYSNYDTGKFTCYIEGRQITDLRLKGLGNYH
ncbi:hypothetical protein [Parasphingorhabdus halotolerans]|uniref:17 kDa surface antigen n=1 Tax=Parasphingorhabdus halotolerans TaxID=2725558 RepID=A0A6H2DNG0_9SPHN|nr:hypothetical protein [Parasphingorhabdus halotolerans]QJB69196.1 hypothetical protein HF685_07825 [Parasphingorhabdus halotolerans]